MIGVNFEKLNSLSNDALEILAEKMGIALSRDFERESIIDELLEALREDSEEPLARQGDSLSPLDEIGPSPDTAPVIQCRYNETMIRVLVRDPAWAFAYWDISEADVEMLEVNQGPLECFLRVVEEHETGRHEKAHSGAHFDIPIGSNDMQWYINLPNPERCYRIDLYCRVNDRNKRLAKSNSVLTPRSTPLQGFDVDESSRILFMLSGAKELDFHVSEEYHPSRILSSNDIEE